MKALLRIATLTSFLLTTSMALAQPPGGGRGGPGGPGGRGGPPPEPSLMTYDLAATAMKAAEAHAKENGWNMSIRIVDQNNNVVMIHRLDNANPRTVDIAGMKTQTVIESKMPSAEYGQKVQAGEIQEIEGAVTFGGGVPVYREGKLIGAIAASGARPEEDASVATAGANAIGSTMMK